VNLGNVEACESQWAAVANCFQRTNFREVPCADAINAYQDCMQKWEKNEGQRKRTAHAVKKMGMQGGISEKWVEE
jgi:type IV secretory pathway TrbF-like protein